MAPAVRGTQLRDSKWSSWGASVIGPLHVKEGLPNQDAWISRHYDWGDVVAVSDGLGSHAHSEVGARAACMAAVDAARAFHQFSGAGIVDILRLLHADWLARIGPLDPRECSATCLFAIHAAGKCLLAQLGDGLVALCGEDRVASLVLFDDKLDSFSNITSSLGSKFQPERWRYSLLPVERCQAVVLCTDGISDDIFPERQAEFAKEMHLAYRNSGAREREEHLLSWMTNWPVPGHSDDKTVACLFKTGGVSQ
jgi:serine/threonine protein phosphatase PrpC